MKWRVKMHLSVQECKEYEISKDSTRRECDEDLDSIKYNFVRIVWINYRYRQAQFM